MIAVFCSVHTAAVVGFWGLFSGFCEFFCFVVASTFDATKWVTVVIQPMAESLTRETLGGV